ncbi:MAG: hypothetical protein WAM14_18745 [Candidatus Nitrosopolaris sp.]
MILTTPNKGHVVDHNAEITASGSATNKTGTLIPVFRTTNDNGDTFCKSIDAE